MKREAQQIAIAKACGWTHFEPDAIQYTARRADGKWGEIPDYLNSLDAMHEAEKACIITLDSPAFYHALQEIIGRDLERNITGDGIGFSGWIAHANAAQRAEAFLRTLNLWTE